MLSFVEVKPDFVFSQYEISIIKSIWRSLDLNNPLNLKDFYYTVSAAINSTGTVTTNGVVSPKRDKFTSLIITQQDIANTISDYQVEEFIEVATSLIHHLEFGKEFPENKLVQLLKRNQRIYKIYYKQYLTLGNSLMEAIEDFTNLLVGKSKRIFSRFLSILLSAILYYSNDISFVDTTTTNSNNTLNINLTATPTTTHSNASIYSELSYSMLSLNTDNTSTSAATTAEAIILEEIIKPPQLIEIQSLLPLDIDEQSQPVQSTPEDVEYAEDATITNSIYTNNTVDNGDANSGFSIVHMIILIHLHFLLIMMMMMMNTIMAKACMRERLLVRNNKRINPKLFMKKKKMMTILMIRKVLFQQCPIYHRLKMGYYTS